MKINYSIIAFLLLFITSIFNCNDAVKEKKDDWQYLHSSDFSNRLDRVNQLKAVVDLPTKIYDAEFELFNVNGFEESRDVPGASSWDYFYVVKLDSNSIGKWLDGYSKKDGPIDNSKVDSAFGVKLYSRPELYELDSQQSIILFREESVLFKFWSNR